MRYYEIENNEIVHELYTNREKVDKKYTKLDDDEAEYLREKSCKKCFEKNNEIIRKIDEDFTPEFKKVEELHRKGDLTLEEFKYTRDVQRRYQEELSKRKVKTKEEHFCTELMKKG